VRANINLPPNVPRVILATPWSGPHANDAPFASAKRAQEVSPGVAMRHFHVPSQGFGVLDCPFNVLIGMPRPAHPANSSSLLTLVKHATVATHLWVLWV